MYVSVRHVKVVSTLMLEFDRARAHARFGMISREILLFFSRKAGNLVCPLLCSANLFVQNVIFQRNLIFLPVTKYYPADEIKKNMMGAACGARGGKEIYIQSFDREIRGKDTTSNARA